MAYTKQTWTDDDPNTPLSAARLDHIEDGIADADAAANTAPTWASVTGKPTTFAPVVGTGATDAKPGNYQPTWAQVTGKPETVIKLPATLGTAGQVLAVNAGGDGLEWIDPA